MIPIGAIVMIGVAVARAISNSSSGTGGGTATPPREISRGTKTFANSSGAAWTVLLQIILFCLFVGSVSGVIQSPDGSTRAATAFTAATAAVFLFPWFIARRVLIPLGLARAAFAVSSLSRVQWRLDKPGGPALAAALALIHQDKPSAKSLAWLEEKLHGPGNTLHGSDVVAMGLLEAMRGNREEARLFLESVLALDVRVRPEFVARIAAEWLATDAATDGQWERVAEITDNRRWPGSPTLRLMSALAHRHLGHALPTNAGLWLWWALAPRKPWTLSFVKATALLPASTSLSNGGTKSAPVENMGNPLHTALKAHLPLLTAGTGDVKAIAAAWEAALTDSGLRTHLMQRATLNGGGNPDDALESLRSAVEASLAPHAEKLNSKSGTLPTLLTAAVASQREVMLRELEDRVTRFARRAQEGREAPNIEEWREFVKLKRAYVKATGNGTIGDRSLAQSTIRDKLTDVAVWLYNSRLQRPAANAIFRFLEVEALSVGDVENERLNKKNAACLL